MVRFVDALIVLIKKGRHVKEKKKVAMFILLNFIFLNINSNTPAVHCTYLLPNKLALLLIVHSFH